MNKNMKIVNYLQYRRVRGNVHGNSHHACLLVPNHLKGTSAKVGYIW